MILYAEAITNLIFLFFHPGSIKSEYSTAPVVWGPIFRCLRLSVMRNYIFLNCSQHCHIECKSTFSFWDITLLQGKSRWRWLCRLFTNSYVHKQNKKQTRPTEKSNNNYGVPDKITVKKECLELLCKFCCVNTYVYVYKYIYKFLIWSRRWWSL
jgi:hypothetical protein